MHWADKFKSTFWFGHSNKKFPLELFWGFFPCNWGSFVYGSQIELQLKTLSILIVFIRITFFLYQWALSNLHGYKAKQNI